MPADTPPSPDAEREAQAELDARYYFRQEIDCKEWDDRDGCWNDERCDCLVTVRRITADYKAALADMTAQRDEAREVVAKVNNSFGSYAYFTEPHPAAQVENLKEQTREYWQRIQELEAQRDAAEARGAMRERERMLKAEDGIGKWLSAALDDPNVCAEMKADINYWFHQTTAALRAEPPPAATASPYQDRVRAWLLKCFGPGITEDRIERVHRFWEEALELGQSSGCTAAEAHQLVDYVFCRPVGELGQEVGGTVVCLAALCSVYALDMAAEGERELSRVWTKIDKIRAKHAAKPKFSPLPGSAPTPLASLPPAPEGGRDA